MKASTKAPLPKPSGLACTIAYSDCYDPAFFATPQHITLGCSISIAHCRCADHLEFCTVWFLVHQPDRPQPFCMFTAPTVTARSDVAQLCIWCGLICGRGALDLRQHSQFWWCTTTIVWRVGFDICLLYGVA